MSREGRALNVFVYVRVRKSVKHIKYMDICMRFLFLPETSVVVSFSQTRAADLIFHPPFFLILRSSLSPYLHLSQVRSG